MILQNKLLPPSSLNSTISLMAADFANCLKVQLSLINRNITIASLFNQGRTTEF